VHCFFGGNIKADSELPLNNNNPLAR
jgi:hypothetical protein